MHVIPFSVVDGIFAGLDDDDAAASVEHDVRADGEGEEGAAHGDLV